MLNTGNKSMAAASVMRADSVARRVSGILAVLLTVQCIAAPKNYECTVKSEFELTGDGSLRVPEMRVYADTTFFVDRATGIVQGRVISNSEFPTREILDDGVDKSSYQVMWMSIDFGDIRSLILDFRFLKASKLHTAFNWIAELCAVAKFLAITFPTSPTQDHCPLHDAAFRLDRSLVVSGARGMA